ncbi:MAG: RNA pseudouridine synthase [Patescibacteria group bacterium]|nr:RNA pseudouridine synthase [Patescibacteria group bacterium]MBU1877070.1 RNA pseudouridine synthase [Patescibacteria group bacterium]
MDLKVLYEDNHLIAVFKPTGILTQRDKSNDSSLMEEVKEYLREKYQKPGNVFLGLLHRLDRPVSGIVLFAKTSKGASRLSEQIRNHQTIKTYQVIVIGKPKNNQATLIDYLKKDKERNRVVLSKDPKRGFEKAELEYETINSNKKYSLLKINLKTGKPHQIRSQLASIGCPVVGDVKYGAKTTLADKSIMLCATDLEFKLATKQDVYKISITIPKKWKNMLK